MNTVMSGPASGVMAAAYTGRASGQPNLITYDMGGTSTDVGLIEDAVPQVSGELELEYAMPIHVPMVDVHTIGAGGGSIASVDAAGMLRVGPESAGARPGPICYGRGGTEPTITDANLVLGRLNPDRLLGVDHPVTLDHVRGADRGARSASRSASTPMRRPPPSCASPTTAWPAPSAWCRCRAATIRATSRCSPSAAPGRCTRRRWRASSASRRCWCRRGPGITNALGCVVADLRHDYVRTVNKPLSALDDADDRRHLCRAGGAGRGDRSATEGVPVRELRARATAPTCSSRARATSCRSASSAPTSASPGLHKAFAAAYWRRFGIELRGDPAGAGQPAYRGDRRAAGDLARRARRDRARADARRPRRSASAACGSPTAGTRRRSMPATSCRRDAAFEGPAILEQLDCTTVVEPGDKVRQDTLGNLLITVG